MRKKHKIVVLSNLKDNLNNLLKNAIKLAQTVDGEIVVLNVQKPTEVVNKESQLSAIRSIHSKRNATDKKMQELIDPIAEEFGIVIKHTTIVGNTKNEISNFIENQHPNLVILGKRKPKALGLFGDGITEYVLNNYKGEVFIASSENSLEPNKNIALGTLNDVEPFLNLEFTDHLLKETETPIKSFKFNTNKVNKDGKSSALKTIEYVFDYNNNALDKLPGYLSKNNINLLLINREERETSKRTNLTSSNINSIINKLNVPLMVMGEKKQHNKL